MQAGFRRFFHIWGISYSLSLLWGAYRLCVPASFSLSQKIFRTDHKKLPWVVLEALLLHIQRTKGAERKYCWLHVLFSRDPPILPLCSTLYGKRSRKTSWVFQRGILHGGEIDMKVPLVVHIVHTQLGNQNRNPSVDLAELTWWNFKHKLINFSVFSKLAVKVKNIHFGLESESESSNRSKHKANSIPTFQSKQINLTFTASVGGINC